MGKRFESPKSAPANSSFDLRAFEGKVTRRLLGWGAANLALGSALRTRADAWSRGFGAQTAGWGLVNAGLALAGRLLGRRQSIEQEDSAAAGRAAALRRLLLANAGLDVLYVAGGWAAYSQRGGSDAYWRGAGAAIMVQGAFLFFFDLLHAAQIPRPERER